jgi:formylglycine-generating enzyme required for sulfatase activity
MAADGSDPRDIEALRRQIADLQARLGAAQRASLKGSGATAQGGGDALGERGVKLEHNAGTIVTGTQIVANYHTAVDGRLSREQIARQVAGYLGWLRARTRSIELRGIERAGGAPVVLLPLEKAYVPLRARPMPRVGEAVDGGRAPGGPPPRPGADADDEHRGERDVALNQVLGLGHRLVIIGGPGSGKTTVLMHMAWALASSLLAGEPESVRARLGLESTPAALPLPIFVPLASFARYRRNLPGSAPAREKTLAHFISHHLISKQADFDLPADFFVQLLGNGANVLLLLDGLDEVANEDERAEVRQSVEELVSGREAMRVAVTCRTVAYRSGRTALGADFREIAVQPLDFEEHIAPMVRQAYGCIHPRDASVRDERVSDLLDGIRRLENERRARLGDEAEALVDSPLMVRLLLIVHVNNRRLPDERADLFDKAINALLQVDYGREESDIRELSTDWKPFRDMAQHLALHMHRQGRDQGREIEEAELKSVLRQEDELAPRVEDFLRHARQRGSVLEERDGVYRFIHLAFQEFLVARYLREVTGGEGRGAILAFLEERLDDPWWREPVLLLAGYMGANAAKSAREFLATLAETGRTANARCSAAELAATAALEWRESGEGVRRSCAGRILTLLADPDALRDSQPVVRARAGDALGRLGDPRFDPQRFSLPSDARLGFVHIPADPRFRIGTRGAHVKRVEAHIGAAVPRYEINESLTPTPDFHIARYPVTVAQFRAFCEATGFEPRDAHALRDGDNRPVGNVTWHEALAYCNWLNAALARSPALAGCEVARLVRDGPWRVTLPSELEWEKAARGGRAAAVYPWGDDPDPNRANDADSGIGGTSAVGCFPANGFGLYDMTGNLWEWTRSLWGTDWEEPAFIYPYDPHDPRREDLEAGDGVSRVVRGGSWLYLRGFARCAYRYWYRPDNFSDDQGFRVVLRSAPVS